jgi:hypothetical protein
MMNSPERLPPDAEGPHDQEGSNTEFEAEGLGDEDRGIESLAGYQEVQTAFVAMRDALVPPPTPDEEAELNARLRERLLASRASEITEEELGATRDRLVQIIREELPDVLRHRRAAQVDEPQPPPTD